jgi:hypothetical protein
VRSRSISGAAWRLAPLLLGDLATQLLPTFPNFVPANFLVRAGLYLHMRALRISSSQQDQIQASFCVRPVICNASATPTANAICSVEIVRCNRSTASCSGSCHSLTGLDQSGKSCSDDVMSGRVSLPLSRLQLIARVDKRCHLERCLQRKGVDEFEVKITKKIRSHIVRASRCSTTLLGNFNSTLACKTPSFGQSEAATYPLPITHSRPLLPEFTRIWIHSRG